MNWRKTMGRFGTCLPLSLVTVVGAYASSAKAVTLASDAFITSTTPTSTQYTQGGVFYAASAGQNPTIAGFSGAWAGNNGTNAIAQWSSAGPASINLPSSYPTGGRALFAGNSDVVVRTVKRKLTNQTSAATSSTYYFSINTQIQRGDSDGAGFVGAGFTNDTSDSSIIGGTDAFRGFLVGGLAKSNGGTTGNTPNDDILDLVIRHRKAAGVMEDFVLSAGQASGVANRILIKMEYSYVDPVTHPTATAEDRITVWLNPSDASSEAAANASTTLGLTRFTFLSFSAQFDAVGTDNFSIEQLTLASQSYSASAAFDEARMGTAFADVAPEPGMLGLAALALIPLSRRRRRGL